MSLQQRVKRTLGIAGLALAVPFMAAGAARFASHGGEYAPVGNLPGDQVHPSVAVTPNGGWLVFEDNATDGDGLGISAQRLDANLSPLLSPFRVNQQGVADQQNAKVAALPTGGAAFVWQGGVVGSQHIFARFISANGTFLTGDVAVNTAANPQVNPAVAVLPNGNVVVTWSSEGQEAPGSMQGVYAQVLNPSGQKVGSEFLVNQFTPFNQRTPAVAALSGGNFVISWVSEQQSYTNSVEIYARLFGPSGAALANEFKVNSSTNPCANPAVAGASDGTFIVSWSERDTVVKNNRWDVYARVFSSTGKPGASVQRVNTQLYGDQFAPSISSLGSDYMVVWTSKGQDGSREGVYGQYLRANGTLAGGEFQVNSTALNQQIHPVAAGDSSNRFVVVWSSYSGVGAGANTMDINSQRFVATNSTPAAPPAPLAFPISSSVLQVTWAPLAGYSVSSYNVYVDGSEVPFVVSSNFCSVSGFAPASSHTFQLSYVLTDGTVSPLSTNSTATTWGADSNNDGLPDDWQALVFGANPSKWLSATNVVGPNGLTVGAVFGMGGNPLNPSTWLQQSFQHTSQGTFLAWTTQPGSIYEVLTSASPNGAYTPVGAPRMAAGTSDSIYLGMSNHTGYFRIVRIRY